MGFQTFSDFVFLAVMMLGYFVLLLAGSCFFYMRWNASYALLVLLSTAAYLCGLALGRGKTERARKGCAAASLTINLLESCGGRKS